MHHIRFFYFRRVDVVIVIMILHAVVSCSLKEDCDCECGKKTVPNLRIVNGTVAYAHEFPWIVRMKVKVSSKKAALCSGSLITRHHILTAAHCIEFLESENSVKLFLGSHDREELLEPAIPDKVTAHELFNSNDESSLYDIGIIQLKDPVEFNEKVQPACINLNKDRKFTGIPVVVAGWGSTSEDGSFARYLTKVVVQTFTRDECSHMYPDREITEHVICAGHPMGWKDSCQGDSGGPLMMYNEEKGVIEVIGLVSYGDGCARKGKPGVYTSVAHYKNWIEKHIGSSCLCHPPLKKELRFEPFAFYDDLP